MKTIKYILGIFLTTMSFGAFAQGLEGIVVEKYYLTDAADAANATTEGAASPLTVGSTVYRVYVDMAAGYKFSAIYGSTTHNLTVNTTTNFYNDPNYGVSVNPGTVSLVNIAKHTAMIDSWFTTGGVGGGKAGVLKSADTDGSLGNTNGVLANNPGSCYGLPITGAGAQDGFANGSVSTYVVPNTLGVDAALDALDQIPGNSVVISNGTIAALGGVVGPTASNLVCIGQFTTDGVFTFALNVQIINVGTGIAENYVASSPVSGEQTHPSLTFSSAGVAPTVSITAPASGASFTVGSNVSLAATAADADGSIFSVEFFVDGVSVGVDNSAPYSATYVAVPGNHAVVAVATDNNCQSTTSASRNFTVPAPVNDLRSGATSLGAMNTYPACNNFSANLALASNSSEAVTVEPVGAGQDLWYRFVSSTGAARFTVTSSVNDVVIELQDNGGALIASENENTSGTEILVASGLTVGATYYVAVRNFNASNVGTFTMCAQTLAAPANNSVASLNSLCSTIKCQFTGASSYTATLTDGTNTYSATGTSTKFLLTTFAGLKYNTTYTLTFTATYNLADGAGNAQVVTVSSAPASLAIGQPAEVQLRLTDQCSSAPRNLNSYISADQSLCAITGYEWEFIETNSSNVVTGVPIYAMGQGTSRYMQLNGVNIPGIQAGDYYRVKIRAVYNGGQAPWPTTYRIVCIAGTAPGMTEESNEDVAWVNADAAAVVYPNPNNGDMFNLNVNGLSDGVWNVQVLDVQGRIVHTEQVVAEGGINRTISLNSTLSNGLYTVRLMNGEAALNVRMIVE